LIAGVLPFRGDVALVKEVHDPAWPLWIPPVILATAGLIVGVAPSLLNGSLSAAATAVAGTSVEASLALWHGVTPALVLSALTLAAVAFAYGVHESVRTRTWKPRRGSEDLYEGALSGLNAISRTIAPALHSASLRTYVMVIVVTSALVGGAALITAPGFGSALPRTSITAPDVLIVVLIIAGAMAALMLAALLWTTHKEERFLYPVQVLLVAEAAPGLAALLERMRVTWQRVGLAVVVLLGTVLSARPDRDLRGDQFRAIVKTTRPPEVTGLLIVNEGIWGAGGFFYVGKHIPWLTCDFPRDPAFQLAMRDGRFNRVVTFEGRALPELQAAGFHVIGIEGRETILAR